MAACNGADTPAPWTTLRNNRSLQLRRPFSPFARTRENLEPLRALAHRIITRDYHRSNASPKIRTSQIAVAPHQRKVGLGLRLR